MYDHISLMVGYINRLMHLGSIQLMIDAAREGAPTNQLMQLELDRRQTELIAEKVQIQDEMFEISRSN